MGKVINSGKEILAEDGIGGLVRLADATSVEAAHSIAIAMNNRSENFIADAMRTCSPNFYGEKVSKHHFIAAMNDAIKALTRLDMVKKSLFYGRDNNLDPAEGQASVADLPGAMTADFNDISVDVAIDLVHGIIGKATEAGELLEALRECYNGNGIDLVNVEEEIGDGFWYDAILLNRSGGTFEQVQSRIIKKLRARFPDKYADVNANERDLVAERAILEDKAEPLVDEASEGFSHTETLGHDPYADGDIEPSKPLIAEAVPASGKEAVEEAAASANDAFKAVAAAQANVGKTDEGPNTNPELAKSAGERKNPLPGENMAQNNARGIPDTKNDG